MRLGAWFLICFSCVAFSLAAYNLFNVITHPIRFKSDIISCAEEFQLTPQLVASVINVESSFNENAKSSKNAIGLMQLKLATANYMNELNNKEQIEEIDLFNPKTNILLGCQYLRYLIDKFRIIETALAAYNAGETRVRSWLKSGIYSTDGKTLSYIPYEETRNYVDKINNNIKFYEKVFI